MTETTRDFYDGVRRHHLVVVTERGHSVLSDTLDFADRAKLRLWVATSRPERYTHLTRALIASTRDELDQLAPDLASPNPVRFALLSPDGPRRGVSSLLVVDGSAVLTLSPVFAAAAAAVASRPDEHTVAIVYRP